MIVSDEGKEGVINPGLQGPAEGKPGPFPSLLRQSLNLGKHIVKEIKDDGGPAPPEVAAERWGICQACPNLVNNRCRLCGCYMPYKTTRAVADCPDKPPRWLAVGTIVPKEGQQRSGCGAPGPL